MKIDTLKELKQLVKACRQLGIDKIKVDNVELELSAISPDTSRKGRKFVTSASEEHVFVPGGIDADTKIDTPDELTEEQLLMWSSQGGQELGPGETI